MAFAGLGLLAGAAASAPVEALAAGPTAQLVIGSRIDYDNFFTNDMSVNGMPAFCANPSLPTPASGIYQVRDFMDGHYVHKDPSQYETIQRPEVRAILYFGWGGPEFTWDAWPPTWYDGTPMTRERVMACEHILLSDTFALNFNYATYGCSSTFKNWARDWITGIDASGTQHVPNFPNSARAYIEARMYDVPASFAPFQLYTGPGTQRIMSFNPPNGEAALEKQTERLSWL